MQDALALLSAALDSSGYIAIRGFGVGAAKDKQPRQRFFAPGDYQGACAEAVRLSGIGYDTYFATSTFLSDKSAEAVNVNAVKCFKVDLDVEGDNDKKYASKKEAVAALLDLCSRHQLPAPVLVDSGYGVHGYWCLADALDASDGKLYSEKLKSLLIAHSLKLDRTVTGDIARVLRVPDTLNNKNPAVARRVKLKTAIALIDTDSFLDKIDTLYEATPNLPSSIQQPELLLGALPAHLRNVALDKDTVGLISGKPKSFAVLIKRSVGGKGCAQLLDIFDKQSKQTEDRWRAGLSIAHFCEDGEQAVHDMSSRDKRYDHDQTVKKAQLIKGPYKCSTFQSNWPELCKDCPHAGNITSPIQLGDYVPLADKKDNVVLAQNKLVDDGMVAYTVPEYPWPYVRGKQGGVYRREADDEDNPTLINKFDLYVVDRLRDEHSGYLVQMRHHHPTDGVIDFTVDAADIGSKDGFREVLNKFGLMKFDKEVTMTREYIRTWMNDLELKREVSMVRTQMGWADGYRSFIIGDREVTATSKNYSRAAPSLLPVTKALTKSGDINEWKKVFNVYAQPGFEMYAFCALTGFGAPLIPLTDYEGMLINAFSEKSGTGKTTTLYAALSIWGSPKGLILTCGEKSGDTMNARFNRMGQYKNLPVCLDEATKLKPEEMSELLLSITQGRGKHRMASSANSERTNNATWATITLSSANTSFIDSLQVDKDGVDGQLMRILEVHLPQHNLMSKEDSDAVFGAFQHHYGHAGEAYIQYLLQNWSRVKPMIEDERRRIDAITGAKQDERYWSATCACIIAGGRLAREFNLHDIDMDVMRETAVQLIISTRARHHYTTKNVDRRSDVLGEFINMHVANTLVVQVNQVGGKEVSTPLREPTRELHIRYERNIGKLYVSQSAFNKYMRERNINLDPYLDTLKEGGVFVTKEKSKRLPSGTTIPGNPVRVYEFNIKDDDLPALI